MILQKDLSVQKLIDEIQKLRNDASLRSKMAENIKKFYVPKAANKIAQEILNSIGNK
jgi:UDP-N-acetylglucosamine:LPS N-acetylglucosamine transferase